MDAATRRRIRRDFASDRIFRITVITPIVAIAFVAGVGASLIAGKPTSVAFVAGASASARDAAAERASTVTILDTRAESPLPLPAAPAIEPPPSPKSAVFSAGAAEQSARDAAPAQTLRETASLAKPTTAHRDAAAAPLARSVPEPQPSAAPRQANSEQPAPAVTTEAPKGVQQEKSQLPPAEISTAAAAEPPAPAPVPIIAEPAPVRAVEDTPQPKTVEAVADVQRAIAEPIAAEQPAKQTSAPSETPKTTADAAASVQNAADTAGGDAPKDDSGAKTKRGLFGRVLGFVGVGKD